MHRHVWRQASSKLILTAIILIAGLITSSIHGSIRHGSFDHKVVVVLSVLVFIIFATLFLHILTNAVRKTIIAKRLGVGRAASLQFLLRVVGYVAILFTSLGDLGVPVGHILLGSAVLGIILGVAAQQALANFFASLVLILSHPFAVGDEITIVSGALGGEHRGTVRDIGLTHTHLEKADGQIIALPNSTLLTGAALTPHKVKLVASEKSKPAPEPTEQEAT